MQLRSQNLTALVRALGLTPGRFKPSPGSASVGSPSNDSAQVDNYGNDSFIDPGTYTHAQALDYRATSCEPEPYYAPPVTDQVFPPFDSAKATIYRYRQQQSVNMGSWFVHENWMTPSIFECASGSKLSELDIAFGWGSVEGARAVLERHWDTWINQSDFDYLASIGINTVRLPIGYWSLGPAFCTGTVFEQVADVYQNSWSRVVRAINMAGKAGIGVLMDLHGAIGSQNGQGHSGVSDGATNLFYDQGNMDKTINVLTFLTKQLGTVTNIVGIQMLNEPLDVPELGPFYDRAIQAMRQASPQGANFPIYLHDGFDLWKFSYFIGNRTDFVVQDYHSYYVFTPSDEQEPASQHTADIQGSISDSLMQASNNERRNLVVDEWSCALTQQSLAAEQDPEEARQAFCTGQIEVYTKAAAGWSFWAYKKEDCENDPGWCFKAAVGRSLPSTFFSYGQQSPTEPTPDNILALFPDLDFSSASDVLTNIGQIAGPAWLNQKREFPIYKPGLTAFDIFYHMAFLSKRDDPGSSPPVDQAIAKGYSDGVLTAKIFALLGFSKLGFTGQYVNNSIVALGQTAGTEGYYRDWFKKGLEDGENIVRKVLKV